MATLNASQRTVIPRRRDMIGSKKKYRSNRLHNTLTRMHREARGAVRQRVAGFPWGGRNRSASVAATAMAVPAAAGCVPPGVSGGESVRIAPVGRPASDSGNDRRPQALPVLLTDQCLSMRFRHYTPVVDVPRHRRRHRAQVHCAVGIDAVDDQLGQGRAHRIAAHLVAVSTAGDDAHTDNAESVQHFVATPGCWSTHLLPPVGANLTYRLGMKRRSSRAGLRR